LQIDAGVPALGDQCIAAVVQALALIDGGLGSEVGSLGKSATAALEKSTGVTTGLEVVIVGDDPASHAYVGSKGRMAKE
ncbi:hypothetical protein ACCS53_39245, partial [Rhizobium ruizarguesonis]